ncbi:MAG: DUF6498-containing protein, partial [Planctomycetota bacterium]
RSSEQGWRPVGAGCLGRVCRPAIRAAAGGAGAGGGDTGGLDNPLAVARDAVGNTGFILAAIGLAASHLISYFVNFLGKGEYRRTAPPLLMAAPYPRIIVLHVAIVLSGFLVITLGQPVVLLILLVVGKTLLDLSLHLREHREAESAILPTGTAATEPVDPPPGD